MGMLKIHERENDGRHFQFIMDVVDLTGITLTLTPPPSLSVLTSVLSDLQLASTRMSPFWILLGLRVMLVVVTTGAIRRAKLQ